MLEGVAVELAEKPANKLVDSEAIVYTGLEAAPPVLTLDVTSRYAQALHGS